VIPEEPVEVPHRVPGSPHQLRRVRPQQQLAPSGHPPELARDAVRITAVVLDAELDLLLDHALPGPQPVGRLSTEARISPAQRQTYTQPQPRQRILTS
jgi:hypothetical protein